MTLSSAMSPGFCRETARHFALQQDRQAARGFGGAHETHHQAGANAVGQIRDDVIRAAGEFAQVELPCVAGHDLHLIAVAEAFAQPRNQDVLDLDGNHAQPAGQQRIRQIARASPDLHHG